RRSRAAMRRRELPRHTAVVVIEDLADPAADRLGDAPVERLGDPAGHAGDNVDQIAFTIEKTRRWSSTSVEIGQGEYSWRVPRPRRRVGGSMNARPTRWHRSPRKSPWRGWASTATAR